MSISPYEAFTMDQERETKGIEFETPWGTFILARPGGANKAFKKRFNELTAPYRIRGIDIEEIMDDEESKRVMIQVYAETVVKGWRKVKGRDGQEIPFSVENAVKLFTDLEELFNVILQAAQKRSLFQQRLQEEDSGNSPES